MKRPVVLVVRSGARPFGAIPGVEVAEYVSHSVEPVAPAASDWASGWDTVIVTSQTAVEQIARDARNAEVLRRGLETGTLVAVGEATAEALRRNGLPPDHVAAGSARSMLEGLSASLAGRRVLWPCGQDASVDLDAMLKERGAEVRRVVLYRKRAAPPNPALAAEILERPPAAFCPTSPAAAEWLFAGLARRPPSGCGRSRRSRSVRRPSRSSPPSASNTSSCRARPVSRAPPACSRGLPARRPEHSLRTPMSAFPTLRLRRLRGSPAMRALVRETRLTPDRFVAPLFVRKGKGPTRAD